jgi:hypothetical protein
MGICERWAEWAESFFFVERKMLFRFRKWSIKVMKNTK